jgi:hypothetical protein
LHTVAAVTNVLEREKPAARPQSELGRSSAATERRLRVVALSPMQDDGVPDSAHAAAHSSALGRFPLSEPPSSVRRRKTKPSRRSRTKEISQRSPQTDFVNALRRWLGLKALPNTEAEETVELCAFFVLPRGDGNGRASNSRPEY